MTQKRSFDFVDTIRCIAMIFIVVEHSFHLDTLRFPVHDLKYWAYLSTVQVSKFGTIAFFILAGFLLGDKFRDYTAGQYLRRRFANTFGPWLLWALIYLSAEVIHEWVKFARFGGEFSVTGSIREYAGIVFLFSNYWFIINFMICISMLLLFKKQLYSWRFGLLLLVLSLFYSVNIYFTWIIPSHSVAIFGFVFYLWLGVQFNKHWPAVDDWIRRISYVPVVIAVLLTFAACLAEISWLMKEGSVDPYNTLRVSNIAFSLAVFVLLLKIREFRFVHVLDPRSTTFGIYLIHYILVVRLLPELFHPVRYDPNTYPVLKMLGFQLLRFTIVYSLTFGLVSLLKHSRLRWMIGLKKPVLPPFSKDVSVAA